MKSAEIVDVLSKFRLQNQKIQDQLEKQNQIIDQFLEKKKVNKTKKCIISLRSWLKHDDLAYQKYITSCFNQTSQNTFKVLGSMIEESLKRAGMHNFQFVEQKDKQSFINECERTGIITDSGIAVILCDVLQKLFEIKELNFVKEFTLDI